MDDITLPEDAQARAAVIQAADAAFEKTLRDNFEERCVGLMQAKRTTGVPMTDDNGCEVTREALCWRKPNGDYGVAQIASAWQGYQWAIAYAMEGGGQ